MNILTLANGANELEAIQLALGARHSILTTTTSQEAWAALETGISRLLILDWNPNDADKVQLIQRIRASTFARAVFILVIMPSHLAETPAPEGSDDLIRQPLHVTELQLRVQMAERVLALTENLAAAHNQLENHAVFDTLTGFMNRAAFLRQAEGELERSRRASLPLSLIALDIDNFKTINDLFGMEMGDEVLEIVARVIREKSRPYDCVGRWTGDEFALALPGVIGADAEKIAGRIIAGVRGTRIEVPKEPPLNVKVSAGIASLARISTSTEIETVIQQAHQAVARAKEAGGNQVFLVYL